ncbi:MAG: thioredoxin domain-containing protein [Thermoplasmatota archaeon]
MASVAPNRLAGTASPYLLQHQENPVDWWPWCDEAFEEAARRDVPVFLSIGYATCHWCHVMAHESFEDEEAAAALNEAFVCIKVDREERPDLDDQYMAVCQATTGSGGWPLTVLLTPERRPFFAGTYFPKRGRGGRPGLLELVPHIQKLWQEDREGLDQRAGDITDWLAHQGAHDAGDRPGDEALTAAYRHLEARFDAENGGFGGAPKFPSPHQLLLLLRHHRRTKHEPALDMVVQSLDAMAAGGVHDHIAGGFHRYSTDAHWLLPHFEKMLYDQAMLAMAYTEAFLATGEERFERVARGILDFVLREMTTQGGAFASAFDADSEGEEGLFNTWTMTELEAALGPDDAARAAEAWNCTAEGNFLDEATRQRTGRNVLHRMGFDPDAQAPEDLRGRLLEARNQRVWPLLDDKVLADWNGLAIAALAQAAQAFDEPRYVKAATAAATFLLDEMMAGGRLRHAYRDGVLGQEGFLSDHGFVAHGLIHLYEATGETRWLAAAKQLTDAMLGHFAHPGGGFYDTPDDGEALLARGRMATDGALPSGNSIALLVLLRLGRITGDVGYEEAADRLLEGLGGAIGKHPAAYCMLLTGVDFAAGSSEFVVVGDPKSADTQELLATIRFAYQPNKVLLHRHGDDGKDGAADAGLEALAPWTKDHGRLGGKATVYACRDHACRQPLTDFHYLQRELES